MALDQVGFEFGRVLGFLSRRQEVIASNIANADTPGYKTRDIATPGSFSAALGRAQAAFEADQAESPDLVVRNDGNNVSIDREARLMAETTLKFTLASQMIRGEIKGIRSAIEEGRL